MVGFQLRFGPWWREIAGVMKKPFVRLSFRATMAYVAAAVSLVAFAVGCVLFANLSLHNLRLQELGAAADKAEAAARYLGEGLPRSLLDVARDYSEWDSIYEMCSEGEPDGEFLEEEVAWMVREVAVNGRPVARLALYGASGEMMYAAGAKGPDLTAEAKAAFENDTPVKGLLFHAGKVYLVAAHPVHTTGSGGPARGALALAQVLEPSMVAEAENILGCKLSFCGMGSLGAVPQGVEWQQLNGARAALTRSGAVLASKELSDARGSGSEQLVVEKRTSLPLLTASTLRAGVLAGGLVGLVVLSVSLLLTGVVLRPVGLVSRKLKEMEEKGAMEPIGRVGGPSELTDLAGAFDRAVAAAEEARKREGEALERLANTDPLTGLANRRRFVAEVRAAIADLESGGRPATLVLFDLNGLKVVNDNLGHAAGDARLVAFAEILASVADKSRGDVAARLGGDEYALLARCGAREAEALVDAVLSLTRAKPLPGQELLGEAPAFEAAVAAAPADGRTPEALLEAADEKVNARKGGGAAGQVRRALASLRSDSYGETYASVRLLLMAADAYDRYTLGHSERVASLAEAVARALGWGEERAARLRLAGLLHDVGRALVAPEVLSKTEELTEEELREVRSHAERGASLLAACPGLADVARWVRRHHERWDGSGYPDGLVGSEIPEESRVLAVADAYDAMTSPRLHRAALSPREAVEALLRDDGYDRAVVEALASVVGVPPGNGRNS